MDTTSGEVLVDAVNVKGVTLESLRNSMSIVPQDTILFNDSIMSVHLHLHFFIMNINFNDSL